MQPRTILEAALCAAALSFAVGGAVAQPRLAATDRAFIEKAAAGGLAEVEIGRLAQRHGASAEVRDFAARMVKDHGKADEELKALADSKGVPFPAALDKAHQDRVDRIKRLSGSAFDKAYMADMLADHKKDVAQYKRQVSSGGDPDVHSFASRTLPTIEEHLELAQQTDRRVRAR